MTELGKVAPFVCHKATFLRRRDLNDVVGQAHVLPKAVADVIHAAICISVRVGCHPVH